MPTMAGQNSSDSLFKVNVQVPEQSKMVQQAAFTSGLQQVLVRLSGDSRVLQKLTLPPAGRYVRQFRYDKTALDRLHTGAPVPGVSAEEPLQLKIQYDADRVETLLRENGIPVWRAQRDNVVVWLAVHDGFQRYLLKRADASLIKSAVEQSARDRGLPVIWPTMDNTDTQALRLADVWGGFKQPLLQASSRYYAGQVLAISLAWDGSKWLSDWTLIDSNKTSRLAFEHADYAAVITQGLAQIADTLGERYAQLEDNNDSDVDYLRVELQGIDSVSQYKRAETLFHTMSAVKTARLAELFEDSAVFRIALRTSADDFLQRMRRQPGVEQLQLPLAPVRANPQAEHGADDSQSLPQKTAQLVIPELPDYRFRFAESR